MAPTTFHIGDVVAMTHRRPRARRQTARFALDQDPQVEGALVAIDPYTGQVKAMVGGYELRSAATSTAPCRRSASRARRSSRSSTPPRSSTASRRRRSCSTRRSRSRAATARSWSPKNSRATTTARRRCAGAHALAQHGLGAARRPDRHRLPRAASSAASASTSPLPAQPVDRARRVEVTPLELTRAYGIFATLGKRFDPIFITARHRRRRQPDRLRRHAAALRARHGPRRRLRHDQHDAVGRRAGHRAGGAGARPSGRGQDRHHERHARRLVRRLHARPARRRVGRLRLASARSARTRPAAWPRCPIWTAFMEKALEGRPVDRLPVPTA